MDWAWPPGCAEGALLRLGDGQRSDNPAVFASRRGNHPGLRPLDRLDERHLRLAPLDALRNVLERVEMPGDIGFRVRDRGRPLLVRTGGHRDDPAVQHPGVVAPPSAYVDILERPPVRDGAPREMDGPADPSRLDLHR